MPNIKQKKAVLVHKIKVDDTVKRKQRLAKKVIPQIWANQDYQESQTLIDEALTVITPELSESELALLLTARVQLASLYSKQLNHDKKKSNYDIEDYGDSLKALLPYLSLEAKKIRLSDYKIKRTRPKHRVRGVRIYNAALVTGSHVLAFKFRLPCCKGWPLTFPFCRRVCDCSPKC